jgi:hypothetical protein
MLRYLPRYLRYGTVPYLPIYVPLYHTYLHFCGSTWSTVYIFRRIATFITEYRYGIYATYLPKVQYGTYLSMVRYVPRYLTMVPYRTYRQCCGSVFNKVRGSGFGIRNPEYLSSRGKKSREKNPNIGR